MCDDETKALLQTIAQALTGEQYESGGIFTIGGVAGTYQLKSPWNTECEYKVICASCSGVSSPFVLTENNTAMLAPPVATASLGSTSQGSESGNQLAGVAGVAGGGGIFQSDVWLPLGKGIILFLSVNPPASQSLFVNIAFRRLYNHLIPDPPMMRPQTHTQVQSRRTLRMLGSLSNMMSGFEQQYPTRLGAYGEKFDHEEIPQTQDPAQGMTTYKARVRRYGR